MKGGVEELVKKLEAGRESLEVVEELGLSMGRAMRMLGSRRGRRVLAGRRRLARIAALLLAQRFEPHAIQRLCELLSAEKAEVRLKGITTLLGVVELGVGKAKGRSKGGEGRARAPSEATPEDIELLELLAAGTRKRAGRPETQAAPVGEDKGVA